jgi:alkylation response protein AidB-like acyl-CoA dehydrogenase
VNIMPTYKAPVADMVYLLADVFDAETTLKQLPGFEDSSLDLFETVLEAAGKLCEDVMMPINQSGDAIGCRLENGSVRTAPGTQEAYKHFVEGGWMGLSESPHYGGQGLPSVFRFLLSEILSSSNLAFSLFPGLTLGAISAIESHASDALKDAYLPKMISGEWCGAMALTEPHSGTDLGILRTRAVPNGDGSYAITGTKIFITAGDQDLTENIIHLTLARLPDAPGGTQGISLFLVPKYLVKPDGGIGARNEWSVGSIEHKMGIMASPTCVINYDGATGWLVGEPNRGLAAMFTMMNAERLFVGVQGLGVAEVAYQNAAAYAKDRLQGRGPQSTTGPAPIIDHPDVRKMLLTVRSFAEAGRALTVWLAIEMDKARLHPDPAARAVADDLVALMTPVVKASFSDLGFEGAVMAQQVLGGHGYVREWGLEQFVRDARIAQIYEGTNGVQAMDLVGRKLSMAGGRLPARLFALIEETVAAAAAIPGATAFAGPLGEATALLKGATARLRERASGDPAELGAAATDYLRMMALVAYGWMWTLMACRSLSRGAAATPRDQEKLEVARFFVTRLLPQVYGLDRAIDAGAGPIMGLAAASF